MSLILDIILIAIFCLIVFGAAKKGLVKSLLELASFVLAVVLSFQLSPFVAEKAYGAFLEEQITTSIEEQTKEKTNVDKIDLTVIAVPEFVVKIAEAAGVDTDKIKKQVTSYDLSSENMAEELEENVVKPVATGALTVISFIVLFILLSILFGILTELIAKVFKLPLIKSANRLLGALFGVGKGLLLIILLASVFEFLFANGNGEMAEAVNSSKVMGLLENINPFISSLKELF